MNKLKHGALLFVLGSTLSIAGAATAASAYGAVKSQGQRKIHVSNQFLNKDRFLCVETWYAGKVREKCVSSNTAEGQHNIITIPTQVGVAYFEVYTSSKSGVKNGSVCKYKWVSANTTPFSVVTDGHHAKNAMCKDQEPNYENVKLVVKDSVH